MIWVCVCLGRSTSGETYPEKHTRNIPAKHTPDKLPGSCIYYIYIIYIIAYIYIYSIYIHTASCLQLHWARSSIGHGVSSYLNSWADTKLLNAWWVIGGSLSLPPASWWLAFYRAWFLPSNSPQHRQTDRQTNTGSCYKTAIPWESYCWRKKSCTTWHVWSPVNHGMNYQPQVVQDVFPSTVGFQFYFRSSHFKKKKTLTCFFLLGTSRFKRRTMFCWETQQCCWSWLGRSGVDSLASQLSFPKSFVRFC